MKRKHDRVFRGLDFQFLVTHGSIVRRRPSPSQRVYLRPSDYLFSIWCISFYLQQPFQPFLEVVNSDFIIIITSEWYTIKFNLFWWNIHLSNSWHRYTRKKGDNQFPNIVAKLSVCEWTYQQSLDVPVCVLVKGNQS